MARWGSGGVGGGKGRCVRSLWVTIGHLRVTMGHLRLTIGYFKATVVHNRVTFGYLWAGNYRSF